MKNKLFLAAFLCFYFFIPSCMKKEEELREVNNLFDIMTQKSHVSEGNITVVLNDYMFGGDYPLDAFDIEGYFKVNDIRVPVHDFTIGGRHVPEYPNYRYYLHRGSTSDGDSITQIANSLYGQNLLYSFKSNIFGDLSATLRMPAHLNTIISNYDLHILDQNNFLNISWQPDVSIGDSSYVAAVVVYHAASMYNEQPGLPLNNITIYKWASDSDGTLSFSPNELSVFSKSSYVTIYVARIKTIDFTTTLGRTVSVINLVLSTSKPLKVI